MPIRYLKTVGSLIARNRVAISSGIAFAGVIATAVTASNNGKYAYQRMLEAEHEKGEELTLKETVQVSWKSYIPTVIVAGTTLAAMVVAYKGMSSQIAALAAIGQSAIALADQANERARESESMLDKGQRKKLNEKLADEAIARSEYDEGLIPVLGGTILCLDETSGRYFHSAEHYIMAAENEANQRLLQEGYISLNTFYDVLGLDNIPIGDELGWRADSLIDVRITTRKAENGLPCLVMDLRKSFPDARYLDFH